MTNGQFGATKFNIFEDSKKFEERAMSRFDSIYYTYFNNLEKIERITNKFLQFKGHDVHLHFINSESLIIDEKARKKDWEDVLIEYLSNKETSRLGWIYKNESNYLAYLFPTKGCYFLDTKEIKAWIDNKYSNFWDCEDCKAKNIRNSEEYTTISKKVPIYLLDDLGFIYLKV